jgi:divalent metal cation (Fe/Co/Zn/Cd) transporter
VTSLAYLSAALALLALGGYILYDVGLWWADAAAAIVISLDIARDGVINVRAAAADLMDSRPTRCDDSAPTRSSAISKTSSGTRLGEGRPGAAARDGPCVRR